MCCNANNQRVAKLIDGVIVEKYLWSDLTTLLAIYDKDDNLLQRFEYADQRVPTSMTSNGTKYYLHYDQVGSLRAVSDTSGNIIKEITYDTYGNILTDTNTNFKVPFGFAGENRKEKANCFAFLGLKPKWSERSEATTDDTDTKLTRFGYRDYDAYTGKWSAKDPIDFNGGDTNLYGYVLGDPVGGIDPLGLYDDPRLKGKVPAAMGGSMGSGSGTLGLGYGANGHLGLVGGSKYKYFTDDGTTTVTCFRLGLGVFFGGGVQGMAGINFPSTETSETDACNKTKKCTESWAIGVSGAYSAIEGSGLGVAGGPAGISVTLDAPLGSPGAGVYGGIDICVIKSCSL